MPRTTPSIKVDAVPQPGGRGRAARRRLRRGATAQARILEAEQGLTFVHPFDDPDVIAGQGTIGKEILRSIPIRSRRSSCRSAAAGSPPASPPS
jgi:threonine dehydratase